MRKDWRANYYHHCYCHLDCHCINSKQFFLTTLMEFDLCHLCKMFLDNKFIKLFQINIVAKKKKCSTQRDDAIKW